MTFSVTKTWGSGDTLTYTDLNQNFTDVETVLNGGIKSENISSSANITASQIQDRYHMVKTVIPIVPYASIAQKKRRKGSSGKRRLSKNRRRY